MNLTKHSFRFQSGAGIAHGSVQVEFPTLAFPATHLRATLAFETRGNPAVLESPTYDMVFSTMDEARAIRCLKSAAGRRGLRRISEIKSPTATL